MLANVFSLVIIEPVLSPRLLPATIGFMCINGEQVIWAKGSLSSLQLVPASAYVGISKNLKDLKGNVLNSGKLSLRY